MGHLQRVARVANAFEVVVETEMLGRCARISGFRGKPVSPKQLQRTCARLSRRLEVVDSKRPRERTFAP
eukprot:11184498-Lingulodinium_polyedra.AAC.1